MQSNHIKPPENHIFANFFRLQGQIQNDFPPLNYILGGCIPAAGIIILAVGSKQAENGLQSRSSKNGRTAVWHYGLKLLEIESWDMIWFGMILYSFVGIVWYGGTSEFIHEEISIMDYNGLSWTIIEGGGSRLDLMGMDDWHRWLV